MTTTSTPINCAKCNDPIDDGKQNSIACDVCGKWYHARKLCSMKRDIFKTLQDDSDFMWACKLCIHKLINLQKENQDIPYDVLKQEVKEVRQVHARLKSEIDQAREQLNLKEIKIIELKSELQLKTLEAEDNASFSNDSMSGTNVKPQIPSVVVVPTVPTSNSFSALGDLEDEASGGECIKSSEDGSDNNPGTGQDRPYPVTRQGKNIFFEADSNGKEVSGLLSCAVSKESKIKDLTVSSTTRPGAPLLEVARNARNRVKDMEKEDWMVLLGGANGLDECECGVNDWMNDIKELGSELNQSNKKLIIVETPYRFNNSHPRTNHRIKSLNNKLKESSDKIGCPFVRLNDFLDRSHYTKHGLHLNKRGKEVLADLVVKTIKFSPHCTTSSNFLGEKEDKRVM